MYTGTLCSPCSILPYFNADNLKIIIFIHSVYVIFTTGYFSDPNRDMKIFYFIESPEPFWGPPNLLLKEYQRLLP